MGIYDYISSTVDSIKQNTSDPTAVRGFFWNSLDCSRAAVANIRNAVAVNGNAVVEKLNQQLPDDETRSQFAKNLVKNSAYFVANEGLKAVPGGSAVANIVSRSIPNDKKSKNDKDLQELKDKVARMEKELNDYKKVHQQMEVKTSKNTLYMHQRKPEDMIGAFMMTQFMCNHFLDDPILPGFSSGSTPRKRNNKNVESNGF